MVAYHLSGGFDDSSSDKTIKPDDGHPKSQMFLRTFMGCALPKPCTIKALILLLHSPQNSVSEDTTLRLDYLSKSNDLNSANMFDIEPQWLNFLIAEATKIVNQALMNHHIMFIISLRRAKCSISLDHMTSQDTFPPERSCIPVKSDSQILTDALRCHFTLTI